MNNWEQQNSKWQKLKKYTDSVRNTSGKNQTTLISIYLQYVQVKVKIDLPKQVKLATKLAKVIIGLIGSWLNDVSFSRVYLRIAEDEFP